MTSTILFCIIFMISQLNAKGFPNCHWVLREDVWNLKVFSCAVDPPHSMDAEPRRYKVSFYAESTRRFFKDRFQYRIIGGSGIGDLNTPQKYISKPRYASEWFNCSKVLIKTGIMENSPTIESAYCPIAIYIKNKNWISSAQLAMMAHFDDYDATYVLPPPEFSKPIEPDPYHPRRPSPSAKAFKMIGTILISVILISSLLIIIGILLYRGLSKMFVNPRKKRLSTMSDRERIAIALRRGELIRQRKRELGMGVNDELSKAELDKIDKKQEAEEEEEEERRRKEEEEGDDGISSDDDVSRLLHRINGTGKKYNGQRLVYSPIRRHVRQQRSSDYDDDNESSSSSSSDSSRTARRRRRSGAEAGSNNRLVTSDLRPLPAQRHRQRTQSSASSARSERSTPPPPYSSSASSASARQRYHEPTLEEVEKEFDRKLKERQAKEEEMKRLLWSTRPGVRMKPTGKKEKKNDL